MARTDGSWAACCKNCTTDDVNDSYGWWSRISPWRMAAKNRSGSSASTSRKDATVRERKGGKFNFGRSKSVIFKRSRKLSGAGSESTFAGFISNCSHSLFRSFSSTPDSISKRTGGPNRRRASSCSIEVSKFSDSSSSSSIS